MVKKPRWTTDDHPIYRLETRRRAPGGLMTAMRFGCAPMIFGTLSVILTILIVSVSLTTSYLESMITTTLAVALLATVVVGILAGAMVNVVTIATTAPMVSGEVEMQSWNLLRTTELSVYEIVLAKLAASITSLKEHLRALLLLRVFSLMTGVLVFIVQVLRQGIYWDDPQRVAAMLRQGTWIPILLAVTMVGIFWLSQPLLQMALNGSVGMAASAYGRSRSGAMAVGLAMRLILWIVSALLNIGGIVGISYLLNQVLTPRYSSIDFLAILPQPTALQQVWITCSMITVYALGLIASQGGIALFALGIAQRRSRRIGA